MVDAENPAVVIDNGSGMVKAGFSGEEAPRDVFPSCVGRPRNASALQGVTHNEFYIGEEALAKKGVLNITNPIKSGKVEDWADMEKVWGYTFQTALRVNPSECKGVLLTEAPLQPKANREKMVEIMFETFSVQNIYVAIQAVMSLYSAGRTTGLVVDSGDGVSHTVPVYDGYSLPHAIQRMEIAGRVLTDYIKKLMGELCGEQLTSSSEIEIVRDIKEKHCFVCKTAGDFDSAKAASETSTEHDVSYTMPDKRVITVKGAVRFQGPELLFKPQLNGLTCQGVQTIAFDSIQAADVDLRKDLTKNIILSGGSTMFDGLSDRLSSDLISMLPAGSDVRIVADPTRKFSVWRGASTLSSLSTFEESWVSKADYEELGAPVIHRSCQ